MSRVAEPEAGIFKSCKLSSKFEPEVHEECLQ